MGDFAEDIEMSGELGPEARRAAHNFTRSGLVHTVASDMHRPTRVRTPGLSKAHEHVSDLVGEEAAFALFVNNPRSIVDGLDPTIGPIIATTERQRRWWRFGLR